MTHFREDELAPELYVFARFHAREGMEEAVAKAMREMLAPVRAEPGCITIDVFRSTRDSKLFCLHSRWVDEQAFDLHATLPHTRRFIETVEPLIEHPLDVARTRPLSEK
ncbi:MAG TPA: putative quinol monooxygenase [Rhizomicrobium sp.]|nr:putative quinol monooxygenase [Rhizomicrobium sp.]